MIEIYGASDDLIELEGDISEEFNPDTNRSGDTLFSFLAFSDGTVLSVIYGPEGIWRINRRIAGTSKYTKIEPTGDQYSDRVILDGTFSWVLFGSKFELNQSNLVSDKAP
jgi:hypothetical protein